MSERVDEVVADRHRVEVDHEAAATQQKQAGQRDDERLNVAEVDDQTLQRAEPQAEDQHQSSRSERMPADHVEIGHHHADEADHRADRQIDAARQDDEGGADGGDDDEGVVGEDVAQHLGRDEIVVQQAADPEQRQEDDDRRRQRQVFLVHRFLLARIDSARLRKLLDWSSSTTMTTNALTTRLYSGGRPLVRIDVVNDWMTRAPRIVMPR